MMLDAVAVKDETQVFLENHFLERVHFQARSRDKRG
jgi:hypothetical protein